MYRDDPDVCARSPRARALIVDHDQAVAEFLTECLHQAGFEAVDWTGDGREGVEMYRALRPDVVLLDADMPAMDGSTNDSTNGSMNGYDSCRRIKAADPAATVFLLTADPSHAVAQQALADGCAAGLLAKPFSIQKLFEMVDRYVHLEVPL
ncbi:MAG: response regulator [Pseudomonadota bacterium]